MPATWEDGPPAAWRGGEPGRSPALTAVKQGVRDLACPLLVLTPTEGLGEWEDFGGAPLPSGVGITSRPFILEGGERRT